MKRDRQCGNSVVFTLQEALANRSKPAEMSRGTRRVANGRIETQSLETREVFFEERDASVTESLAAGDTTHEMNLAHPAAFGRGWRQSALARNLTKTKESATHLVGAACPNKGG